MHHKLFSFRKAEKEKELTSDVLTYEKIPLKLKKQIILIMIDTIGTESKYQQFDNSCFVSIRKILYNELGTFSLFSSPTNLSAGEELQYYLIDTESVDLCLDVIELICQKIKSFEQAPNWDIERWVDSWGYSPIEAIKLINERFLEAGIGYEFIDNMIVRIDSKELHKEIVKPSLHSLSSEKCYSVADGEYRVAFDHYRNKRYEETLVSCGKAFESVMKAICTKRNWTFKQTAPAKDLISICIEKKLLPEYSGQQLTHLRCLLESGTPTLRNRDGAHGKGTQSSVVTKNLASYALHLAATNIVFLIENESGR